ncbi:alpha/beta hydrolase [Lacihabitans soyangensis]|nr:alpha/beta hydrolase [Lacihabitans soyangensis]
MYKKTFLLLFVTFSLQVVIAQSKKGLTYQADTSFTKYQAVKWALSQSPNAKLAIAKDIKSISIKENIKYTTEDGMDLMLDIFSPINKKNAPCLIILHGGGWRSGDRTHHHEMAKVLASRGYVVVTPSYRLSTHALYPAAMVDAKTAIRWTRANAQFLEINPEKIALAGFSAGGQMAALVGTTNDETLYDKSETLKNISSKVASVIDIDGILAYIHTESGEGDDSRNTSAATYYFGFSKTEKPELWNEASALNHVSAGDPPILFINSSQERMHAGREDMIKKLNGFGIYSEVHTFNAPHTFCMLEEWFLPTIDLMDKFLIKTLKP